MSNNSSLLTKVRGLLNSHKGEWETIGKAVGRSHSWVAKVAQGRIPNPGVNEIEKIYDLLKEAA